MISKALLLLTVLTVVLSETMPIVGSYQPYNDLTSLEFQKVLKFIYAEHPEVSGWKPIQVRRQLVAGWNWYVHLTSGGSSAETVVYAQFDGTKTITYWKLSNQNNIYSGTTSSQQMTQDQEQVQETDNENTTQQNNTSKNESDEKVSLNGVNEIVLGGYEQVTDSQEYAVALNAIIQLYPEYNSQNYEVEHVYMQIVAGKNFILKIQHTSQPLNYIIFKVYIDLEGKATVTQLQKVKVQNYTIDEVKAGTKSCYEKYSQLDGFYLYQADNIRNGEGLSLIFSNDEVKYRVYVYRQ